MKLEFQGFQGELPKIQPRYLQPTNAVSASGARLNRGDLAPMRNDAAIHTLPGVSDYFYLHNGTYLAFSGDADVVPGPVAADRLYITRDSGAPQLWNAGTLYNLALPAPVSAPGRTLGGTLNPKLAEDILYCYTWVTSLGEESAPGPLSASLSWSPGCTVTLTLPEAPPAGRLITTRRIYRSQTSVEGVTALYFIKDLPVATTPYVHNLTTDPLGELISSSDYDPPPAGMRGIIAMPNGMMCAFNGKELLFSEPYRPHAWPAKYALAMNDTIVGLAAFGTTVAVMTTGFPYIVQGLSPDAMASDKIEQAMPCLAKRGIVDMGYFAIYPSTNGLARITSTGAELLSQPLWDRDQWTALNPSTFRADQFTGRYAFSYQPVGAPARLFAFFDLTGELPFLVQVLDSPFRHLFHDVPTGRLMALLANGTSIVSHDDTTSTTFRSYAWTSKPTFFPTPVTFGAVMVEALPPATGTPAFALEIYAGGVLIQTYTTPNVIERVVEALDPLWQIRVTGNWTVTRIVLAGDPDEVWQ